MLAELEQNTQWWSPVLKFLDISWNRDWELLTLLTLETIFQAGNESLAQKTMYLWNWENILIIFSRQHDQSTQGSVNACYFLVCMSPYLGRIGSERSRCLWIKGICWSLLWYLCICTKVCTYANVHARPIFWLKWVRSVRQRYLQKWQSKQVYIKMSEHMHTSMLACSCECMPFSGMHGPISWLN